MHSGSQLSSDNEPSLEHLRQLLLASVAAEPEIFAQVAHLLAKDTPTRHATHALIREHQFARLERVEDFWLKFVRYLPQAQLHKIARFLPHKEIVSLNVSGNVAYLAVFKRVQYLFMSFGKLTSLPPEVLLLNNLRALYLNNNQLESLPAEIAKLEKLKKLDLRHNAISAPELARIRAYLPACEVIV